LEGASAALDQVGPRSAKKKELEAREGNVQWAGLTLCAVNHMVEFYRGSRVEDYTPLFALVTRLLTLQKGESNGLKVKCCRHTLFEAN
jgi:hypothetical protein